MFVMQTNLTNLSTYLVYLKKIEIKLRTFSEIGYRSEPDFYWGNSPLNFNGQNPGGESFPTFPSGGYAHADEENCLQSLNMGYLHIARFQSSTIQNPLAFSGLIQTISYSAAQVLNSRSRLGG